MRRLVEVRDAYRRAELRLRQLLFGDEEYAAGAVRGEDQRQQARAELRRMRKAFDEALCEAESSNLVDDLTERATEAREEQSDRVPGDATGRPRA